MAIPIEVGTRPIIFFSFLSTSSFASRLVPFEFLWNTGDRYYRAIAPRNRYSVPVILSIKAVNTWRDRFVLLARDVAVVVVVVVVVLLFDRDESRIFPWRHLDSSVGRSCPVERLSASCGWIGSASLFE